MERHGYRGYISSRPVGSHRVPQHIQNLTIREYAERNQLAYLLSGVEYCMENSYLMLNEIAAELESIEGIILYSMFMLPNDKARRSKFFKRVIDTGAILHAAVEGVDLFDETDLGRWEDIFLIDSIVDPIKICEDVECRI